MPVGCTRSRRHRRNVPDRETAAGAMEGQEKVEGGNPCRLASAPESVNTVAAFRPWRSFRPIVARGRQGPPLKSSAHWCAGAAKREGRITAFSCLNRTNLNRTKPESLSRPVSQINGGERGIRTLGTGLSRTHTFQACSLNHSDISPQLAYFSRQPSMVRPPLGVLPRPITPGISVEMPKRRDRPLGHLSAACIPLH